MFSPLVYSVAWWYFPLWIIRGDLNLPFLTINQSTRPILLNLLAFERLHLGKDARDMIVTHYVILMSCLIRSKNDVEYLRCNYVLSSLPGRSDEKIVKLFADMTHNVVVDDITGVGVVNKEVVELCYRRPNMLRAKWLRHFGSDLKVWINVLLTGYGVAFAFVNTYINVMNYTSSRGNNKFNR